MKSNLSMNGENQLLVTDEPFEFEKQPVEGQDIRENTEHFRGIYIVNPSFTKKI
jgi:hypothetical protein